MQVRLYDNICQCFSNDSQEISHPQLFFGRAVTNFLAKQQEELR